MSRRTYTFALSRLRFASFIAHTVTVGFAVLELLLPLVLLAVLMLEAVSLVSAARFEGLLANAAFLGPGLVSQQEARESMLLAIFAVVVGFGLLVIKIVSVWRMLSGVWRVRHAATSASSLVGLRRLTATEAPSSWRALRELAGPMGIDLATIDVRFIPSACASPVVTAADGRVFIGLSFGAQVVSDYDYGAHKAMLAHELAHVRQGDTTLWGLVDCVRDYLVKYIRDDLKGFFVALFGLFFFVVRPMNGVELGLSSALGSALIAGVLTIPSLLLSAGTLWIILRIRAESEREADRAAVVFGGREALARAIERFSDPGGGSLHPPEQERLAWLK